MFEKTWDKIVFIGSIIGLIFLIAVSLFRYFVLFPAIEEERTNNKKSSRVSIGSGPSARNYHQQAAGLSGTDGKGYPAGVCIY